jgi:alpha-beta hydrolase superfamily lysophospholipase
MERELVEFESHDGLTLRGSRLLGPGRPKATVILTHGYGEHAGRYAALLKALTASRFAVWGINLRGHGRSDGDRAFEPEFGNYLADMQLVVERARAELPGRPVYLLGHSLGGLIALSYALDHQDELDGLVLLAPALRFWATVTEPTEKLVRRIAGRAPNWPLVAYIPGLRSKKLGTERTALSDPLVYHGWVKAGTIVSIGDAGANALARAPELQLPVLTMHGDGDRLIHPDGSKALYQAIGVRPNADNSLVTWPGMRHELLNEADAEQVIGVVLGWLNGHYTEWRKANPSGVKAAAESA